MDLTKAETGSGLKTKNVPCDRADDPGPHVGQTTPEDRQARDRRGNLVFPAGELDVAARAT